MLAGTLAILAFEASLPLWRSGHLAEDLRPTAVETARMESTPLGGVVPLS